MAIARLIDDLEARLASPAQARRARAPEPRIYTYLENLGEIQLFGYNYNRYLSDAAFNCEMQLRQRLFHLDNFEDDTVFTPSVSAAVGMYFEFELIGAGVKYQDDGVPVYQQDHPLRASPNLALVHRHDFRSDGVMQRIFQLADDLERLVQKRLEVRFPLWERGPLDMAIHLRGYENIIADTAERPDFLHGLLKLLTDERIRWWDAYCAFSGRKDRACGIADDWINAPFISPEIFEEFLLPRYLELEAYHGGLPRLHSCGNKAPMQKLMARLKTLPAYEVNHWTSLEETLANVPADKFLTIRLLNADVLLADECKMRVDLQRIASLCRGRRYSVCAEAIQRMHADIREDIEQVKRWLQLARQVLCEGR